MERVEEGHPHGSPLIKVNQVTSPAQARTLDGVDILGVCLCRDESFTPGPFVPLSSVTAIRHAAPAVPLSVAFAEHDLFTPMEIADLLVECEATFFEFTPPDVVKPDALAEQLDTLAQIGHRSIANGFVVQTDDASFLDDAAGFRALQEAGVELFQFEIRSAVVPSIMLSQPLLAAADALFADLPVIVSDQVARVDTYPLGQIRGMYFNLRPAVGDDVRYDFSELAFPLSRVIRILEHGA